MRPLSEEEKDPTIGNQEIPNVKKFPFLDPGKLVDDDLTLVVSRSTEARIGVKQNEVPPTYFFEMRHSIDRHLLGSITIRIAGIEHPFIVDNGHVGYTVKPKFRGKKYAARACKLLFPLAKKHGLEKLVIVCDSSNFASCRTCEICGGVAEEITVQVNSKTIQRKRFLISTTDGC